MSKKKNKETHFSFKERCYHMIVMNMIALFDFSILTVVDPPHTATQSIGIICVTVDGYSKCEYVIGLVQ